MTQDQRDAFCQEVIDALNSAPEAMSEGRPHRRAASAALDALWLHFKSTGRQIYVADDLAVLYPGEPSFASDLLAVLDVPQPDPDEDERMAWVVADEGKGPDFVLEVLHRGDRHKDLVRNVQTYAALGIQEYFIFDRAHFKLYGYRLPRGGTRYQELRPRLGRISSQVLGLDLALTDRRLRFFAGMGELVNSDEFIALLSKMMNGVEARAQQAEERAEREAEQARREAEQAHAEARAALLDLAEVLGLLPVPAAQQQQIDQADTAALIALRAALKQTRAWP